MKAFKHAVAAQACYFVLGSALLTGWNAFLTASDYFGSVFPGRSIDRVFTVAYLPITLVLIGLVSRWPHLFGSPSTRITAGYCLFTAACAAVPLIDVGLVQQGSVSTAYAMVLLCVVLVAVGDGLTQPTVYADAALLPDRNTQAVVMGAAASGVSIGVLRVASKGALPQTLDGLRISTQVYFALSAAITAAALLLYHLVLPQLDVVAYYRGRLHEEQHEAAAAKAASQCGSLLSRDSCLSKSVTSQRCTEQDVLQLQRRLSAAGSPESVPHSPRLVSTALSDLEAASERQQQQQQQQTQHPQEVAQTGVADTKQQRHAQVVEPGLIDTQQQHERQQQQLCSEQRQEETLPPGAADTGQQLEQQSDQQQLPQMQHRPWWRGKHSAAQQSAGEPQQLLLLQQQQTCPHTAGLLLGELSWLNILRLNRRLCVAVFLVYTVTLSIFPGFLAENVSSAVLRDWYPVLLIFSYNLFDFAGRCIPDACWCPRHTTLLALSVSRLSLIPLYAGLAVYGAPEAAFFVLTSALGLSNGWLTMLIFCSAPRGLSPSAAELAGMVNVFAELAGLNAGAYLGWLWTIGKAS